MTENTSLQQKLEQYSTTARGQTTHSLSAAEIAGYAAAAAAALTMAGAADAAIIYSGVQNISVQINPNAVATGNPFITSAQTAINIDGGGADINATVGLFAAFNTTNPTQAKYYGIGLIGPVGGALLLQGTQGGVANLPISNQVGPGGNFGTDNGGFGRIVVVGGTNPGSLTVGNFALGVTGIAGIQLASGNFGWIRLRIDDLGLNQPFGWDLYQRPKFPGQGDHHRLGLR